MAFINPLSLINGAPKRRVTLRTARTITTIGVTELAEPLPTQSFLVRSLGIGPGAPTCIAGYGFAKKTLAVQSLPLDVATGGRAWGVYECKAGRALHLDYEQGKRITQERYQRLARARGIDLLTLKVEDRLRVGIHPGVYLTAGDAEDVLMRTIDGFDVVVIDSLKAATAGADENSSEIRQPVDLLGRVSERTGATILVMHHARKPKVDDPKGARYAMRGSSALYDAMASVFVFEGSKTGPTRVLHEKCRNVGTTVEDFGLAVEDVEIDGDPRAGLRVVHLEPEQLGAGPSTGPSPTQNIDRIRAYLVQVGRHLGSKDALRERVGMGQGPFRSALSVMHSTGEVLIESGKSGMSIRLRDEVTS
jgi:AAA domain